jgi:hypothetical protein
MVGEGVPKHVGEVWSPFGCGGEEGAHRRGALHGGVARAKGSSGEGWHLVWWSLAPDSGKSGATVGCSSRLRQGGTMAGGAGQW